MLRIIIVLISSLTHAETCGLSRPLNLVFGATRSQVAVTSALTQGVLHLHFEVQGSSPIWAPKVLPKGKYPYQFDVVEAFVGVSGEERPYYEIEVSPYNQTFSVFIDAHAGFHNNVQTGALTDVNRNGRLWSADMALPLPALGWKGDAKTIRGNIFAILGKERSYYSLNLPPTHGRRAPNFHQPQFFTDLAPCQP